MLAITTINDLANETYLELFEYLPINELFTSFWNLNYRLNNLICDQRIPLSIHFTGTRKRESVEFAQRLYQTSIDLTCIRSYTFSSNDSSEEQHLFISSFSKLQSLTIESLRNADSNELKQFLFEQKQHQSLQYTSIKAGADFSMKEFNEILDCVYQIQSLTTLKLYGNRKLFLQLSLPFHMLNIQRLTLVPFPTDSIMFLKNVFAYLPNLWYLHGIINHPAVDDTDNADRLPLRTINHHSYLYQANPGRHYVLNMNALFNLTPNLKQFYLDLDYSNGKDDVEQIISSSLLLSKLEKFILLFHDNSDQRIQNELQKKYKQNYSRFQYDRVMKEETTGERSRMKMMSRITVDLFL